MPLGARWAADQGLFQLAHVAGPVVRLQHREGVGGEGWQAGAGDAVARQRREVAPPLGQGRHPQRNPGDPVVSRAHGAEYAHQPSIQPSAFGGRIGLQQLLKLL
jgi:hypothetical protein